MQHIGFVCGLAGDEWGIMTVYTVTKDCPCSRQNDLRRTEPGLRHLGRAEAPAGPQPPRVIENLQPLTERRQ